MSDHGLSTCPECHYDLRAQPPPNRCPECGFDYDERSRVWRARPIQLKPVMFLGFGWAFMVMLLRNGLNRRLLMPWTWSWIEMTLWLFIAGLMGMMVYVSRRSKRMKVYVALHPTGVLLRTRHGREVIAWDRVEGITDWPDGQHRIKCEGRGMGMVLNQAMTHKEISEMRRLLPEYKARYTHAAVTVQPG